MKITDKDMTGAIILHSEFFKNDEVNHLRLHIIAQDARMMVLEVANIKVREPSFEEEQYSGYDRSNLKPTKWEFCSD